MPRHSAFLALVTLVASAAPPLHAQGRDRGLVEMPPRAVRSGLYFVGALGAGSEQCKLGASSEFPASECGTLNAAGNPLPDNGKTWRDPITSPAFALRLGGTPSPSVRLGAELMGWSGDNGPTTERTVGLLATAQFYPSKRAGFYLKGGLGYGWSSVDFNDGSRSPTETGFLFNVGAGYEFALTPHVAIAPLVDFYQGVCPRAGDQTITERIAFFGVSLTVQSGDRRWR